MSNYSKNPSKQRNYTIDVMKSILVILMIAAHVVQFIPCGKAAEIFSAYVNLTTFSGFMFTFGYVCNIAYLNKKADAALCQKLCKKMLVTILAFYISGIAYSLLVTHQFGLDTLFRIITFSEIPGYSEFLLSFALLYPIILAITCVNRKLKPYHLVIMAVLSLLLTRFPYGIVTIPIVGVLIGTDTFACFPIIQYFSYFIAGVYLSSGEKTFDWKILTVSILGTMYFVIWYLIHDCIPKRFPPHAAYIVGGYAFVYVYYLLSGRIGNIRGGYLLEIGRNSLIFLVISNIVIFIMKNGTKILPPNNIYAAMYCLVVYILCFVFSYTWLFIVKKLRKQNDFKTHAGTV